MCGCSNCSISHMCESLKDIESLKERVSKLEEELAIKCGKWIWDSNAPHREHGAYKCSNCGCHSDFEENYCPNCGVDMRTE